VNDGEMSCAGRAFNGADGLAGRLLGRPALASQQVSPTDSVLGPGSAYPGNGLRCGAGSCTYRDLFAAAFGAERAAAAEATFSRLFGQAVAAYESTLVPDDTPFDRWIAGDDAALTATQQFGVQVFVGKAGCAACHAGPELTDASPSYFAAHGPTGEFGNDTGYHNIGVTATEDDLGRARLGPKGVSYSRSGSPLDRGAFKTPGLRNVALTAPYFHNGGSPTLQAVMNFYDRGGDHENVELSPRVQMLGLQPDEFQAVVDLLQNGLTDCRVATQKAPFDHPSIDIAGGPRLPAVGAEGTGPCP
jgi:cytochrome c peroxidase